MWLACVTAMASWSGSLSPDFSGPLLFPVPEPFFWISGSLKSKPLRSHWLFVAPRPEGSKYSGMFERGRGLAMHATVVASGISVEHFFFPGLSRFEMSAGHCLFWQLINVVWCTLVIILTSFHKSNYHKSAWGCVNINWDVTSLCFLWELEFDER